MRRYLSFGGGVDSTAMLILLTEEELDFEAVFVDHGADYPETYEHVAKMQELGYPITVIKPQAYGEFEGLYDYCEASKMVPVRIMRWCTQHFKIEPLYAYFETPCEVYIGIDADEPHRARDSRNREITNVFPLVERGIGRAECERIIAERGITIPMKSGCWFCPFQRRSQWVELNRKYPDLWCKALALEAQNVAFSIERGHEPMYLAGRPLTDVIRAKDGRGRYVIEEQGDLFDDRRPCQCGL